MLDPITIQGQIVAISGKAQKLIPTVDLRIVSLANDAIGLLQESEKLLGTTVQVTICIPVPVQSSLENVDRETGEILQEVPAP